MPKVRPYKDSSPDSEKTSWQDNHAKEHSWIRGILSRFPLTRQFVGQVFNPTLTGENGVVNNFYEYGDIRRYGGDSTGVADSTTAFNNCYSFNSIVYMPKGSYVISAVTISTSGSIYGDGFGVTSVFAKDATSDVFTVTGSSVTFRDFTIDAGPTRTNGRYINCTASSSLVTIEDVYMLHWFYGIELNGAEYFLKRVRLVNGIANNGQAIRIGLVASPGSLADVSLVSVNIDNPGGSKPDSGIVIQQCGDVSLIDCQLQHCKVALRVNPGASQVCASVRAVNSFFDNAGTYGVLVQPQSVSGTVNRMCLATCWASSAGTNGMLFDTDTVGGSIDGVSITDVECYLNGTDGIRLAGAGTINVQVNGGKFAQNGNNGFTALANVTKFKVENGRYGPQGSLTGNGNDGIQILAGTSDEYQIIGNDCTGNTVAGVVDGGTGTSKVVSGNLPNPGVIPITVGASPFTFTNNVGSTLSLTVSGGTVSGVLLGAVTVATATNLAIPVPQGQSVQVTYTAAPSMGYQAQ
jgi:hypothetical protein